MGLNFNTVGAELTPLLHVQLLPISPLYTCTYTQSDRLDHCTHSQFTITMHIEHAHTTEPITKTHAKTSRQQKGIKEHVI